jgi:tripartite-type tricarboxylate transporter receptor subunit TctC
MKKTNWTRSLLLAGLTLAIHLGAQAQANAPMRWIVPFPPGGAADQTARLVAQEVGALLGVSIILDNKGGAGGTIAGDLAARAKPDGRTFFVGANAPMVLDAALYAKMPYDPVKDFVPVAGLGKSPLILSTRKDLGANDLRELIALAQKQPLSMGSAGTGNITHIAGEYANAKMGFKVTHVPFPGSAPAETSMMGGNIDIMYDSLPSSLQPAKSGLIKALAVLDTQRFPQLPQVPTLAEAGFPNAEASGWIVLVAPAKTPDAIVRQMNKAINDVLRTPELTAKLQAIGEQPMPGSPEDLGRFMAQERGRWLPLIRALGIKPE